MWPFTRKKTVAAKPTAPSGQNVRRPAVSAGSSRPSSVIHSSSHVSGRPHFSGSDDSDDGLLVATAIALDTSPASSNYIPTYSTPDPTPSYSPSTSSYGGDVSSSSSSSYSSSSYDSSSSSSSSYDSGSSSSYDSSSSSSSYGGDL